MHKNIGMSQYSNLQTETSSFLDSFQHTGILHPVHAHNIYQLSSLLPLKPIDIQLKICWEQQNLTSQKATYFLAWEIFLRVTAIMDSTNITCFSITNDLLVSASCFVSFGYSFAHLYLFCFKLILTQLSFKLRWVYL